MPQRRRTGTHASTHGDRGARRSGGRGRDATVKAMPDATQHASLSAKCGMAMRASAQARHTPLTALSPNPRTQASGPSLAGASQHGPLLCRLRNVELCCCRACSAAQWERRAGAGSSRGGAAFLVDHAIKTECPLRGSQITKEMRGLQCLTPRDAHTCIHACACPNVRAARWMRGVFSRTTVIVPPCPEGLDAGSVCSRL